MHEHVLVDFIGAAEASPSRYDADAVFKAVLPHLQQAKTLGCDTLVECTPAYLGRDPRLLKRLSEASGVHILSNTGYYGAAKDKHLPAHAFDESAEQLAARWVRECARGIDDTGIKPAFMKIGVDESPLSPVDAKLVRAAAIAHRETGVPIASHTTTGAAALEELDLLEAAAVPLSAFIWVHAHAERDETFHVRAARRGAWVEFDGISPASVARHVALVGHMKAEGLLRHVLVSHDAGWYRVGEPGGGQFRPVRHAVHRVRTRPESLGIRRRRDPPAPRRQPASRSEQEMRSLNRRSGVQEFLFFKFLIFDLLFTKQLDLLILLFHFS